MSELADREPISAFIIAFNEADDIAACIDSVSFCDEILVIDSYSTDDTVAIAKRHGATVIQRDWPGYRKQKAFGLTSLRHEWVINLDADERVSDELRESILTVLRDEYARKERVSQLPEEEIVGYYVSRVVFYLGRWWRRGGWYPEYRLRVFKKSRVVWGGTEPHEKAIAHGRTARLEGELQHYTYKNLNDQFQRLHALSSISAQEEFHTGSKATIGGLLFNPLMRVFKFYVLKKGFLEGVAGMIVAIAEGYYTYMKYAKLWEHHFNQRRVKEYQERSNVTINESRE